MTTSDILPGTINSRDVGFGSLDGGDIADGTLQSRDFGAGQLPAGPQGPKGDTGAAAPAGAKGDTGSVQSIVTRRELVQGTSGQYTFASVSCQAGEFATGGGVFWQGGPDEAMTVKNSGPVTDGAALMPNGSTPNGWAVTVFNSYSFNRTFQVTVICAASS